MHLLLEKCCCFCQKTFKGLEIHYKGCPERHGADYHHLLSEKTKAKKQSGKAKKAPCPKCDKHFLQLETQCLMQSHTCVTQSCTSPSRCTCSTQFCTPSPKWTCTSQFCNSPSKCICTPRTLPHPSHMQAAHNMVLYPMSFVHNSHECPTHTPIAHTQLLITSQSSPTHVQCFAEYRIKTYKVQLCM